MPKIELLNMDCMDYLREQPDKSFDLAIVDPPYGIGVANQDNTKRGKLGSHYEKKEWDKEPPNDDYFSELFRVSKNRVIWGANHFISRIPIDSSCWIVWNKQTVGNTADCELAWSSFKTSVRRFDYLWEGFWQGDMKNKEKRIHPTQKPMRLYQWLLTNYSEPGQRILDTHLGSGSSAIAAHYFGVDFVGIEIDEDYYNAAVERFNNETKQLDLLQG